MTSELGEHIPARSEGFSMPDGLTPPGTPRLDYSPTERVSYDPGTDAAYINVTAQFPVTTVPVEDVDWLEFDEELFGMVVHLVNGLVGVVEVLGVRQLLGDDFARRAVIGRGDDLVRVSIEGPVTRLAFATDPESTVTPIEDVAAGGSARPSHLESAALTADFEYHPNGTLRTITFTTL